MTGKFYERFNITISNAEAQKRFVNRVHNQIYETTWNSLGDTGRYAVGKAVANALGERHTNSYVPNIVGADFGRNLQALEAIYATLGELEMRNLQTAVGEELKAQLGKAEVDLGVKWENGLFYPSGAKLLDERLVNDSLGWLRDKKHRNVLDPFEKALRHLLEARKRPELAGDVVTDMYEALEALAGVLTGRAEKDLSANQELFIKAVKASDAYKKLLKDYIEYANLFRHAEKENKPRPKITLEEAESFVYLTGVFVRLATVG